MVGMRQGELSGLTALEAASRHTSSTAVRFARRPRR
jgi:hypothetical protein